MSFEAAIPWFGGTALAAITLLEPFSVPYRDQSGSRRASATLEDMTEERAPSTNMGFYESIRANVCFAPPPWIFAIWTVLYLAMSIAQTYWALAAEPVVDSDLYLAIWVVYFVHLFFNKIWSAIFFGFQSEAGVIIALIDILLVLGLAITQLVLYWMYGAPAVTYVLHSIYLVWILFATVLSIAIFAQRKKLSYSRRYKLM